MGALARAVRTRSPLAPPPSLQVQGSPKSCVCREKSPRVTFPEWEFRVYLSMRLRGRRAQKF